ncbi:nuclear transport factor 2 family protein [Caballeronia sp. dw_19]|uniref:nuclear transport factor 2 family protein n=1 Tax=Caballeronia sp. dw_19 TaxID=2719791 RepID=UPI001BD67A2D|nr:nuclear transport factor 2 family protein [Caballeronia sp. dw_19]
MNLQQLTELENIRQAKARYCRFIDLKQWDSLKQLFAPQAHLAFYGVAGELLYEFSDLEQFIELTAATLHGAQTIHQVHNPEIELTTATTASAIWSMEDYIVFPASNSEGSRSMHGYGHYHETWHHADGDWIITHLELRRTIFEIQKQDHQA